jgi:hypothetical protein
MPREPEPAHWLIFERFCVTQTRLAINDFYLMSVAGVLSQPIFAFKHRDTRRCVNLDADGRCYAYRNGTYYPIDPSDAIDHVLS